MLSKETIKELVKRYVEDCTRAEALDELESDMRYEVLEYVEQMNDDDLLTLLQDNYCGDLHKMDELDNTFDYMTVTEVLEELKYIDTCHCYFNADTKQSSDDLWELSDVDSSYVSKALWNYDIEWDDDDLSSIFCKYDLIAEGIREYFKFREKAEALFDQLFMEDPEAVVTALWNINRE